MMRSNARAIADDAKSSPMATSPALHVHHVTVHFNETLALQDVSFDLPAGEFSGRRGTQRRG